MYMTAQQANKCFSLSCNKSEKFGNSVKIILNVYNQLSKIYRSIRLSLSKFSQGQKVQNFKMKNNFYFGHSYNGV